MLPNIKKFVKPQAPESSKIRVRPENRQNPLRRDSAAAEAGPRRMDWRIAVVLLLALCFFIGTSSYNYFALWSRCSLPIGDCNDSGAGQTATVPSRETVAKQGGETAAKQGEETAVRQVYPVYTGGVKWSSPDETANYYFSKLYAEKGELSFFENLNLYAGDIIHPRSMRSDAGEVKPTSFLGIILIFGTIAKITSVKVLPYLTPLFGAIGIVFFYLLIKKIFGRKNAFLSAFLLASFPPFVYYSARSMFHNILFVVLMIVGLYFVLLMIEKKNNDLKEAKLPIGSLASSGALFSALGGAFIGLAVITRVSELIWILPMLFIIWIFNVKRIGFIKLIIFLLFLFLSLTPMFYWNKILYGAPLNMGYGNATASRITPQPPLSGGRSREGVLEDVRADDTKQEIAVPPYYQEVFEKFKNGISLFGFSPKQSLKMLYYYFTNMFPWLFWGAFLGFLIYLWGAWKNKKWEYTQIIFFISYFIISLILIFYYGSWEIHDNPDPDSFTIGNSYTRYWLPVYLGAMPLLSALILKLTKHTPTPQPPLSGGLFKRGEGVIKSAARVIIVAAIFIISIQFVLAGSEEGLIMSLKKHKEAKLQYDRVLALTGEGDVIITQYHDKLFFPERKVIVGLFNDQEKNKQYAKLVNYAPVYYYNFTFPQKDLDYLNNIRLKEAGLAIFEITKITDDFSLYKLRQSE